MDGLQRSSPAESATTPSGWTKRKVTNGTTIAVPYLRVANVQAGYLDLDGLKTIEVEPTQVERYSLRPGDVLFTEGSAKQTTNLALINSTQLMALPVPLLSMDEQRSIIAAVGATGSRIESERACADALRAGKLALMSVLLTGELRVTPDEDAA